MKELLFATGNASKVSRFYEPLLKNGILLKSLKDIDIKLDIDENGKDAIENASIKAKAYCNATQIPTLAMDDTMFIEGIPDDKQPGIYVRRVNGKRLNDDEMIEHYTNLVKTYGKDGKLTVKWISAMVIIKDGKAYNFEYVEDGYYIVDTPTADRKEGYPLSSILVNTKLNKYDIYLTEEDKKTSHVDDSGFINFIVDTINER